MKFNLKNLVLPISIIISSIVGNYSSAKDELNNNIIPLDEDNIGTINNTTNNIIQNNNNNINATQQNNNNLLQNVHDFTQNNIILNINNSTNSNNTLLGKKRNISKKDNNVNEQNAVNHEININNQNNIIIDSSNNTVTNDQINDFKSEVSNWLREVILFHKKAVPYKIFKSLENIYSQKDYIFDVFQLQLRHLSEYESTSIVKLLGIYTYNKKEQWAETLKNDLIASNWFQENKDNIKALIEFVNDREIGKMSKYKMFLRKYNNVEILTNEIKQNYTKYVTLFYNMQLYLLQKMHDNIFSPNYNNDDFENLLTYIQQKCTRYIQEFVVGRDRVIDLHLNEFQSLITWLMYCDINKHMDYSKKQYKMLLEKYKPYIFPVDISIETVKTTDHFTDLGSYLAKSLLFYIKEYIKEIDAQIRKTNSDNEKYNIIKKYVNNIISSQSHKITNQQNLTHEQLQNKTQKLANCILTEQYLDGILSLSSNVKINSYGKKSFVKEYQAKTQSNAEYNERMKPIVQLIQLVFKSTKKYIYEILCDRYHIIPDNSFINESITDNQYFTGFMKNFDILNKIKDIFKINNDVYFESSLAKYLLLGCCNLSKSDIDTNELNKNIIENKVYNNITKEEINHNNKEEKNKKDFLEEIKSKYILKQILSHLYENNNK